ELAANLLSGAVALEALLDEDGADLALEELRARVGAAHEPGAGQEAREAEQEGGPPGSASRWHDDLVWISKSERRGADKAGTEFRVAERGPPVTRRSLVRNGGRRASCIPSTHSKANDPWPQAGGSKQREFPSVSEQETVISAPL